MIAVATVIALFPTLLLLTAAVPIRRAAMPTTPQASTTAIDLGASREAARSRWLDQIAHRLLGFTPSCKAVDEIQRIQLAAHPG